MNAPDMTVAVKMAAISASHADRLHRCEKVYNRVIILSQSEYK